MNAKICSTCKNKNNPTFEKCWKCGAAFQTVALTESEKFVQENISQLDNLIYAIKTNIIIRIGAAILFVLLAAATGTGNFFAIFIGAPAIFISDIVVIIKTHNLLNDINKKGLLKWSADLIIVIQIITCIVLSFIGASLVGLIVWFKARRVIKK